MFGKKSQAEIDSAFLKAVGNHNFGKAKKMLEKGANVLATDADGNSALHRLAGNAYEAREEAVDEFVCFLLNKGLDINERNGQGKTCLHIAAANKKPYDSYSYYDCSPTQLVNILLNRGSDPDAADVELRRPLHDAVSGDSKKVSELIAGGAEPDVRDNLGQTPLHIAAASGAVEVVHLLLKEKPSLIGIQDSEGKYPHESAIAKAAGFHALSRELLEELDNFNSDKEFDETISEIEETTARMKETTAEIKAVTPAAKKDWVLLDPEQVEHTEKMSSYRLTHIFNFRARTYTQITHNLETKSDVVATKSFDDFTDKSLFEEAYREQARLGGKADESAIQGPVIKKDSPKPSPLN